MSSLTKSQKEKGLIILAIVFLLALGAYSYFMVYAPAKDARLQAEQTLSSERDVLIGLQTQLKEIPEGEKISTSELQQKVSIEPLSELLVLQIEQAELLSESLVTDIGIAEEPVTLPVPVEGLENLQQVKTTVGFQTADYKGIITFIKEIEAMERILVIDSIDFGSNKEVTTVEAEKEPLDVTLSFSAYFRPDLIALADTLPKVDAPPPAGKMNPLPQNDGTALAEEETVPAEDDTDVDVDVEVNVEADESAAADGQ
ncbi:pilus assembly protein PilO [Planococcus shenhongbingii]|uniref:Pilus assembly protein PilO n=1 Tax=Planococcus shenhongbingii TaxID=3058398 RepID=A0ABT8NDB1_9BACL|nr:pilus assembly protein PilO [Planococcus sp. N017]MDN7245879.1 pilus assembly protein PilO [Planococcus sp. N017]